MQDKTVGKELLAGLAEVRALFPRWRLGQLVANLGMSAGLAGPCGVWEAEDAHLLAAARHLVEQPLSRRSTEGRTEWDGRRYHLGDGDVTHPFGSGRGSADDCQMRHDGRAARHLPVVSADVGGVVGRVGGVGQRPAAIPRLGEFARHLVGMLERGETASFSAIFGAVERLQIEGEHYVQEAAVIGLLEDLQNLNLHTDGTEPEQFRPFLGPASATAWDRLYESWRQVMAAKAAGLL